MEGLERLKYQMDAVGMSIAKAVGDGSLSRACPLIPFNQEMCLRDLNIELEKLKSTEKVDSAQAATVASHKDWLDTKSVGAPKGLTKIFSSLKGKQRNEETLKSQPVFEKYCRQGGARKSDYQVDLMRFF